MRPVDYPAVRAEVIEALKGLADPAYQRRVWLDPHEFDSLTHAINVLFDDSQVLPDPSRSARTVGAVVYPHEVAPLARVGVRLGEILERLGGSNDREYLGDADWPAVIEAASAALAALAASEVERADDR